jgi:hypothetical protein
MWFIGDEQKKEAEDMEQTEDEKKEQSECRGSVVIFTVLLMSP